MTEPPTQNEMLNVLQTEGAAALQELIERNRLSAREADAQKPRPEPRLDELSGAVTSGCTGIPRR